MPLETLLSVPLIIRYSETNAKQYPYTFCNKVGCVARIGFSQDDIDLMKAGDRAMMSITHIQQPDQAITLPMSLALHLAMIPCLRANHASEILGQIARPEGPG